MVKGEEKVVAVGRRVAARGLATAGDGVFGTDRQTAAHWLVGADGGFAAGSLGVARCLVVAHSLAAADDHVAVDNHVSAGELIAVKP